MSNEVAVGVNAPLSYRLGPTNHHLPSWNNATNLGPGGVAICYGQIDGSSSLYEIFFDPDSMGPGLLWWTLHR